MARTRAGTQRTLALAIIAAALVSTPAKAQAFRNYQCEGGAHFELAFLKNSKAGFVQLDGKSLQMPRFISITGARYRKGGVTIWIRGERATLRRSGKRIECKLQQ